MHLTNNYHQVCRNFEPYTKIDAAVAEIRTLLVAGNVHSEFEAVKALAGYLVAEGIFIYRSILSGNCLLASFAIGYVYIRYFTLVYLLRNVVQHSKRAIL